MYVGLSHLHAWDSRLIPSNGQINYIMHGVPDSISDIMHETAF